MSESDINLLILPNNGRKGVFTGKLFDYLSVLKPILAIVDKKDVAATLINELNAGYVAEFDDIKEIEKMIILSVNNWVNKVHFDVDIDGVEKLHRKYQVKKLERLIDKILD